MATLISRLSRLGVLSYDFLHLTPEILAPSPGALKRPQIFGMVMKGAMERATYRAIERVTYWAIERATYWAVEREELADMT